MPQRKHVAFSLSVNVQYGQRLIITIWRYLNWVNMTKNALGCSFDQIIVFVVR